MDGQSTDASRQRPKHPRLTQNSRTIQKPPAPDQRRETARILQHIRSYLPRTFYGQQGPKQEVPMPNVEKCTDLRIALISWKHDAQKTGPLMQTFKDKSTRKSRRVP